MYATFRWPAHGANMTKILCLLETNPLTAAFAFLAVVGAPLMGVTIAVSLYVEKAMLG